MTQTKTKSKARKLATNKAWLSVVRAYNLCDATMAAQLAGLGLRVGEHEVLANLLVSPGITQQELAQRCFVAKSGISMLLSKMATQGLLRRESDPQDGRIKRLTLSAKGEALAQKTVAIQDEVVAMMMAPLSDEDLSTMHDLAEIAGAQLLSLNK